MIFNILIPSPLFCHATDFYTLFFNPRSCCQRDQKPLAIGLHLCLVRGTIAVKLATFLTTVKNHKSVTRIGLCTDRLHRAAARVGAITGINIDVHAPKAKRTMIARGKAKRFNLATTVQAREATVVF